MHLAVLALLTFIFYSLLRALFLVWNFPLFADADIHDLIYAFRLGMRFDLMVVVLLTVPAFLLKIGAWFFKKSVRGPVLALFLIFQVPPLILNLVDVEFFNFMGRRFIASSFVVASEIKGKMGAVFYSYAGLFFISLLFIATYLSIAWIWHQRSRRIEWPRRRLSQAAFAFVAFLITGLGIRGGLQSKPLNLAHAQVFPQTSLNNLVVNSTFSLIKTLRKSPLPREKYMSEEEMITQMNGYHGVFCQEELPTFEKKQNIVLIALESFSLEFMGKPHGDRGYTPFLDSLAERSLFFRNAYANGRRSIEGMAALVAGIPNLMREPFISSPYSNTRFSGLGSALGPEYHSTFYHGGTNGTMFFDHFSSQAGITRYYGSQEYPYPEHSDGIWGIFDEPFLVNMAEDLSKQQTPFSATVLTLSSHNPYRLPEGYEDKFPKGPHEVYPVVGYADQALRRFFAVAEKQPWYRDTLFILSADHTHTGGGDRPRYFNELGNYRIPILFFHPQISKWPDIDTQEPVQQIDILPSIMDFLKKKPPEQNYLGRSVFCKGPREVVIYLDNSYWLITRDRVLYKDPRGDTHLSLLENYFVPAKEPMQFFTKPGDEKSELILKQKLSRRLQATRQYFSEAILDNRLNRKVQ
jgi:phosphoglycerol transferase MdoB-like AlkP superfamily enzyme